MIKILDLVTGEDEYLVDFDPEFTDRPGTYPTGQPLLSDRVEDAMKFDSFSTAMLFYRTQSVTVPFRPDGKPNRPLTALMVEISNLET